MKEKIYLIQNYRRLITGSETIKASCDKIVRYPATKHAEFEHCFAI